MELGVRIIEHVVCALPQRSQRVCGHAADVMVGLVLGAHGRDEACAGLERTWTAEEEACAPWTAIVVQGRMMIIMMKMTARHRMVMVIMMTVMVTTTMIMVVMMPDLRKAGLDVIIAVDASHGGGISRRRRLQFAECWQLQPMILPVGLLLRLCPCLCRTTGPPAREHRES